jgi:hypothetical protein
MEVSGQLQAPTALFSGKSSSPFQYPLSRRLGIPPSRSGHGGEEKNIPSLSCREMNTGHPSRSLVTILSQLDRLTELTPWCGSHDSSVGIALGYGLDDRGSRVRFPAGPGNFSLHRHVQNGSGAHPAFYPVGTRGSFPGCKAAGA